MRALREKYSNIKDTLAIFLNFFLLTVLGCDYLKPVCKRKTRHAMMLTPIADSDFMGILFSPRFNDF